MNTFIFIIDFILISLFIPISTFIVVYFFIGKAEKIQSEKLLIEKEKIFIEKELEQEKAYNLALRERIRKSSAVSFKPTTIPTTNNNTT
jgi:hypothetical protein